MGLSDVGAVPGRMDVVVVCLVVIVVELVWVLDLDLCVVACSVFRIRRQCMRNH